MSLVFGTQCVDFKIAVLVFQCLTGHAPAYLADDCQLAVILLHTLVKIVKIVRSHHCLFVCCSYFSFFYFCYHSW